MYEGLGSYAPEVPLGPIPSERQTRAAHLQGFTRLVCDLGREPDRILEKHDIDPGALTDPESYVDCSSLLEMIEYCSSALNQPLFGVLLARCQSTHVLGNVAPLSRAAPNLRTAIQRLCEYLPIVHSPECRLELLEGERISELRYGSRSEFQPMEQMIYGGTFTLLSFLKELGDEAFSPEYVTTIYAPPRRALEALEGVIGCRVHARASANAIGFSNELLARPLRSSNRFIFRLLDASFARIRTEQRRSLIQRVEDYLRGATPNGFSLARCASALGLSARALQIKLCACGVSFSDLLRQQRAELAQTYLASGDLMLDEIAHRLGYAEQTSFGRAFRRWTGFTPGEYQARKRSEKDLPGDRAVLHIATQP